MELSKHRNLIVLSPVHFLNDLYMNFLPPVLPVILASLALTHFQAGLLVSAVGIVSAVLQPVVGHLAEARGVRKTTMVLGVLILGAGVSLFSLSQDFSLLLVTALLISLGLSTYHPQGLAFLSEQYHRAKGRIIGFHGISGALGFAIAPIFMAFVESSFGWQRVFSYAFLPALLAAVFLSRFLTVREVRDPTRNKLVGKVGRDLVLLGISAFTIAFVFRGIIAFIPTFYVNLGESLEVSNLILFATLIPSVVGAPIGGHISDRFGRLKVIALTLVPIGPLLFLFSQTPGLLGAVLLFTIGLFRALNFPVYLAHASDITGLGEGGSSIGLVFGSVFAAGAISPSVIGYSIDILGYQTTYQLLAMLALVSVIPVLLALRLRRSNRLTPR
ncbi:MAG: MFS transporter [Candidatus Geothermarchaeales archaeon]